MAVSAEHVPVLSFPFQQGCVGARDDSRGRYIPFVGHTDRVVMKGVAVDRQIRYTAASTTVAKLNHQSSFTQSTRSDNFRHIPLRSNRLAGFAVRHTLSRTTRFAMEIIERLFHSAFGAYLRQRVARITISRICRRAAPGGNADSSHRGVHDVFAGRLFGCYLRRRLTSLDVMRLKKLSRQCFPGLAQCRHNGNYINLTALTGS